MLSEGGRESDDLHNFQAGYSFLKSAIFFSSSPLTALYVHRHLIICGYVLHSGKRVSVRKSVDI